MNQASKVLLWEGFEHGILLPVLGEVKMRSLGNYRLRGLGDTSITLPTDSSASLDLSSIGGWPIILGAGALLLVALLSSAPRYKRVRRKTTQVSGMQTAILALGAGAGGYLLGRYTSL